MREDVRNDWAWSDQYIPAVKRVLGPLLLEEAPLDLDTQEATDLLVFTARDMRIACRIRRADYLERFGNEFTIRYSRDNGHTTEWAKIVDGWGDWMIYGFADPDEPGRLARWTVIDLRALRACLIRNGRSSIASGVTGNGDGTTFKWIKIASLPKKAIVAANWITHPVYHKPNL